jgi:hypothetical protein
MVASGAKTIETRRWPTDYRGPLLIVSSKLPAVPPAGYALAIATLVDCRPMTSADESAAKCDFYQGAYAWVLSNIRRVKPFPVRGKLGIYEVPAPEDGIIFE